MNNDEATKEIKARKKLTHRMNYCTISEKE